MKTQNILTIILGLIIAAFITPAIAGFIGDINFAGINIVPIGVFGILTAASYIPAQAGVLGAYANVNVVKPGRNAGLGGGLKDEIIFFDMDDVATIPARDANGVLITGDIAFNAGGYMFTVYATPGSIENNSKSEGDFDAEGIIQSVKFSHPGSEKEVREFRANFLSRNIGIIHRKCSDAANMDLYGTKCVPLRLSFDWKHGKDSNATEFTLTSAGRGEDVAIYTGTTTFDDASGSGV